MNNSENTNHFTGHLAATLTIVIWGTTFVSTKILLAVLNPLEILLLRFLLGIAVLFVIHPHRLQVSDKMQEFLFAGAGLCGITLYYLLENIALTYSLASNVGVIICISPFFTALLSYYFLKGEPLRFQFFIGFFVAISGIFLISFNGRTSFQLNPLGDFLAIVAAFIWSVYSVLTRKISEFGYNTIQTTRRIFFYGLVFMFPSFLFFSFDWNPEPFFNIVFFLNILYLGLGASALCFVTWNFSVKVLGTIRSSVFIYLVPVITVLTSAFILHETISLMAAAGTVLTLIGLAISENRMISLKRLN